ncbi:MAG: hypothetical protein BGN95_06370 [Sphingomonas sp. 66-10]|nr:MAG: hypothetical protein BGN95_06370 [Sphingomonas sp. 66-10]
MAGLSALDGNDFASVIMAACRAQIVRTLQFATVRAFLKRLDRERIVRATHAAAGRRSFSLGDGHRGTLIRIQFKRRRFAQND